MAHLGRGKDNLTVALPKEEKDYFTLRARNLGWSVSQFGGAVFDAYLRDGAPPVHPRDKVLPIPKFPKKARYERL